MIFIGGRILAFSMLCNVTPPVGVLFLPSKSIKPKRKFLKIKRARFLPPINIIGLEFEMKTHSILMFATLITLSRAFAGNTC